MAVDFSQLPVMDNPVIDVGDDFSDYSSDTINMSAWDNFTSGVGSIWDLITSPTAKNLLNLGSGLYGLYESGQQRNLAKDALRAGDPFGPYRKQYADQLMQLMADPTSITKDPGYQFQFDQGQQAVERAMSAKGFLGSGNEGIALTQYGQNFAKSYLNDKITQLSGLAGAGITPNLAPGLQGYNMGLDTASNALASLGYAVTRGGSAAGTPSGPSAAGGEAAKVGGVLSAAGKVAGSVGAGGIGDVLGTTGSTIGNFGNIISGIERGDTKGYGSAVSSGAKLADLAGLGGPTTSTVGAVGDIASGNYLGAAKDLFKAAGGAGAAASGAGALFGTSGAAALGASAPVSAGSALSSLSTATAGDLFGTSASAAAGAGAGSLGAAGGMAGTEGAVAAGAGGTASALGTLATGAGYAGLVIAAGQLLHKAFNANGSLQRNRATFEPLVQSWTPTQIGRIGAKGMNAVNAYNLPGKGWVMMTQGQLDELTGNLYGALYHPDGDQAGWQSKLDATLNNLQPITQDSLNAYRSKYGGAWDDTAIKKILGD